MFTSTFRRRCLKSWKRSIDRLPLTALREVSVVDRVDRVAQAGLRLQGQKVLAAVEGLAVPAAVREKGGAQRANLRDVPNMHC